MGWRAASPEADFPPLESPSTRCATTSAVRRRTFWPPSTMQ
ncbi:unnamed protein product [Linum tenue]|uniref:Uncharacterized protein n=1 Tax=Linum tenue TaxID=586396 RepID=A0AAV0P5P1_9ROSI|nr:unnamed protein product [Linum tenue]CAI0466156.1 unnamed protein product [Linum tenue]